MERERAEHFDVDVSAVARLIGDPTRATLLDALLGGSALPAGELARLGGVHPATASHHLARLQDGGLVTVTTSGRHRYYRLAGPEVATALESLALVSPPKPVRSLRRSRAVLALHPARTCYDHLAGVAGVRLLDALIGGGWLTAGGDGYLLTDLGERRCRDWGLDPDAIRASRRSFARPCLDLTERQPHLAGALGAAFTARMLELGWFRRRAAGERGLRITEAGRAGFAVAFGRPVDTPAV